MYEWKRSICNNQKNFSDLKVIECLEFENFFAFGLVPLDYDEEKNVGIGGGYDTVSKKDGTISTFNPTQDFEAFDKAKEIDIESLN